MLERSRGRGCWWERPPAWPQRSLHGNAGSAGGRSHTCPGPAQRPRQPSTSSGPIGQCHAGRLYKVIKLVIAAEQQLIYLQPPDWWCKLCIYAWRMICRSTTWCNRTSCACITSDCWCGHGHALKWLPLQIYAVMVRGGYVYSIARQVASSLLYHNLLYGRLHVLSCAKRLLWLHAQHSTCIDGPRKQADAEAYFTGV